MPGPSRRTARAVARPAVPAGSDPRGASPCHGRPDRTALARVLLPGALLVAVLLGGLLPPAAAAERTITVTSEGVRPQVLTVAPGDTVRFVVEDDTFGYRAQSTGEGWRFDSGPVELLSGQYVVPDVPEVAGTYTYRVAQDPPFQGVVQVTGSGTAPLPAPPTPSVAGASPEASSAPTPAPGPSTAGAPGSAPPSLAQPSSARPLGLPSALALLLVVGTASLLWRTLLAEPVLSHPGARVRAEGGRRPRW